MRTTAAQPATPSIPGPLSATACTALSLPPLARPKRGPQGPLGSSRGFHLLLWGRDTGMPWPCWPVPTEAQGHPALHATTVSQGVAPGAAEGALGQACVARVRQRVAETQRDRRVRPGDGPNPVAPKGGMAWGVQGSNTRRVPQSSRAAPSLAPSSRRSLGRLARRPPWSCSLQAGTRCRPWPQRLGGTAEGPLAIGMAAVMRPASARACARLA